MPFFRSDVIPYGYCHCGCGQRTSISKLTDARKGAVAGEPRRFLIGHQFRLQRKPYRFGTMNGVRVVFIHLGKERWAIIWKSDLAKVKSYCWCHCDGYAAAWINGRVTLLHRFLLGLKPGQRGPDHENRNGLDNRRSNLRPATQQQNTFNQGPQINNKSGYKGVYWDKSRICWAVEIHASGKHIHVGRFPKSKKIEAAKAYDEAARKHHGEFAYLNFPEAVV